MSVKKLFIKVLFAELLAFGLECLCLVIQYIYQLVRQEYWIKLGFPFNFYGFSADFEFHGVNTAIGFIYDAFLLFVFSFLLVHIWMSFRSKRKKLTETDRIDEHI